jgi:hypothetical protein
MPLNNIPVPLDIHVDNGAAYAAGTLNTFSEVIRFGSTRYYSAIITKADADNVQQDIDLTGWQFRHQIGAAVEYTGESAVVASIVIANADIGAFTLANGNELEWSISCNTDEWLDAITDPSISKFVTVRSELWGRADSGSPWEPIASWDLRAGGAIFDVTQTPTSSLNTYYTAAQTDAVIAAAIASVLTIPAGYRLVVDSAGNITVESVT